MGADGNPGGWGGSPSSMGNWGGSTAETNGGGGLTTGNTIYGNTAFGNSGGMAQGYATVDNGYANTVGPGTGSFTGFRYTDGTPMFAGTPMANRSYTGATAQEAMAKALAAYRAYTGLHPPTTGGGLLSGTGPTPAPVAAPPPAYRPPGVTPLGNRPPVRPLSPNIPLTSAEWARAYTNLNYPYVNHNNPYNAATSPPSYQWQNAYQSLNQPSPSYGNQYDPATSPPRSTIINGSAGMGVGGSNPSFGGLGGGASSGWGDQ